jgi:predicted nuclease of predicted toxin-antitoxin system
VVSEVRFYFDEMIPHEIAERLRHQNIDVLTTPEAGNIGLSDADQLVFALEHGRVLVTRDEDYLIMNSKGTPHFGIVYYKQETRSAKEIAQALILIHGVLSAEEMRNQVEHI